MTGETNCQLSPFAPVQDIHFTWSDGSRRLTLIRSCTSKQQGDRNRRARGLFQARWFRLHTHCTRRGRRRAVPRRHSSLVRVLGCAGPLIIIHMKAESRRQPAAARRATEATPRRTDITRTHYKASRLVWSLARGCAVVRSACCVFPSPLSPSSQRGAATA